MRAIALAILLLAAAGQDVLAGTHIETETRGLGSDPAPTRRGVFSLEPDRMRLDVSEVSSAIIYRGDLDLVWIVDHGDRSFASIDRATMSELSRRMVDAKAELRSRLAALPPEQRAVIERALGETLGPEPEELPAVSVRETGRTDRVNGVGCTEFELRRGQERVAVACTADWESAGVERETFRPIYALGSFLRQTLSALPDDSIQPEGLDALEAFGQLEGVPLRIRIFEGGTPTRETRVTSIERRSFAKETFEVPEGYREAAPGLR